MSRGVTQAEAKQLFTGNCEFLKSVVRLEGLPTAQFPELALIGRSNVGKSSLINALTGKKGLARTSVTPGRTQQLNFFLLDKRLMLVDLPGYGFAKAPKKMVRDWNRLIRDYLRGRPNLRRVCVLIDARRGVMDIDHELMDLLDESAVPFQVVLTKADKISTSKLEHLLAETTQAIRRHAASHPEVLATSSEKNTGIDDLRRELTAYINH